MKPNMDITKTGRSWTVQGTTVAKNVDNTEMLFRIVTMTSDEVCSLVDNISHKELGNICKQIRAHRAAGVAVGDNNVTSYVVKTHTKRMGWVA
jgi:hypothetical protein